jgi:hypothetical protein
MKLMSRLCYDTRENCCSLCLRVLKNYLYLPSNAKVLSSLSMCHQNSYLHYIAYCFTASVSSVKGGVAFDYIASVITGISISEYKYDIQFYMLPERFIYHSLVLSRTVMKRRMLIRQQMSRSG